MAALDIDTDSTHTMSEVFDRYATAQDDYAFQRTHVVVALAQAEGQKLISRSQAKRILAHLTPVNANEEVQKMIRRAEAARET
jgi:hypothetical protein